MSQVRAPVAIPRHVLDRPDMRAALASHDFGVVFVLARKWAGISYSRIADACDIKPTRVGTLARGHGSIKTYEKIALIADALRIPGHMLGLTPRGWESTSAGEAKHPSDIGLSSVGNGDDDVRRRDFLRGSLLGSGVALGASGLAEWGRGRRCDAGVVNVLRKRTAQLRRLDDVLGGGDTYRLYRGEYELTKSILGASSCAESTEKQLLAVLAEQAQQAGWAAFDMGDHHSAEHLYGESRTAAVRAGDAALTGNALAFLAYLMVDKDPRSAVDISEESCRVAGADLPVSVRALLHERRAWVHAVVGNANDSEAALAAAQGALAEDDGEPQPDWSSWVDATEVQIMAGRCWTELRRPLRAVPPLEEALAGFDDGRARDKALYSCWLAKSYLISGEVEAAAGVADRVLDLSAGVASVRPRQRVEPILRELDQHQAIPVVARVMDKARL